MKKIIFILMLVFIITTIGQAQIVYVNIAATGSSNGSSWTNAYTDLTDALLNTSSGEIWVAQGSYLPSKDQLGFIPASNTQKTYVVPAGVSVYGGFDGTETLLNQRDWRTNLTILEGDFGSNNCTHIITQMNLNNLSNPAHLDGFTIQNGNSNNYAGGLYQINSSIIVHNCIFQDNDCITGGAAVYSSGGNLEFLNCIFDNNYGISMGGGAIQTTNTTARIENCLFINNESDNADGGAIYVNAGGSYQINNCTFTKNERGSGDKGKSIYVNYGSSGAARMDINNCIFTDNLPFGASDEIHANYIYADDTIAFNNVMIDGAAAGINFVSSITRELNNVIATSSPLFVDEASHNYELECQSLAVNAGQSLGLNLSAEDLSGKPRILRGPVDLGAYENSDTLSVTASDISVCPGGYVTLYGSCDSAFSWSNGVVDGMPFSPTTTTTYTCTGIPSGETAQVTIQVVNIQNETVTGPNTVCIGDVVTVSTGSSVAGEDYYLIDTTTNIAVDGPVAGTGSGLSFNTQAIQSTKTYEVYGVKGGISNVDHAVPNTSGCLNFDGSNDKVRTSLTISPTSSFTI